MVITATWTLAGVFVGYFLVHPLVMVAGSVMGDPALAVGNSLIGHVTSQVRHSFSAEMAPWGLAFGGSCGIIGFFYGRLRRGEIERVRLLADLQEALANVKTLRGLLPICAACKKIRDDKGYWNHIESYIEKHSNAEFTHGICPECAKRLYPEAYDEV